ncbi:hypothetical protein EVAR_14699_1 [Eumeta japonica]|uniref:Uncharacterized protein n=1 Tax=Eumeta variegata TaxID=151549 RepID=A0A4C1U2G4_EUMVA|nr:hypothetical protein EVAR_14699_1 [Eumeta japonica]
MLKAKLEAAGASATTPRLRDEPTTFRFNNRLLCIVTHISGRGGAFVPADLRSRIVAGLRPSQSRSMSRRETVPRNFYEETICDKSVRRARAGPAAGPLSLTINCGVGGAEARRSLRIAILSPTPGNSVEHSTLLLLYDIGPSSLFMANRDGAEVSSV